MRLSTESREALIQASIQAKEHAHFPYSNFRVGAALMCMDGTIVKGASIDNAAYCATTCAERSAMVSAIVSVFLALATHLNPPNIQSEGKRAFSALAVVSDVVTPISPCGLCRQVIREFCEMDMPVLLVPGDYRSRTGNEHVSGDVPLDGGRGVIEVTVGGLLPQSLGPGEFPFEMAQAKLIG